MLWHLFNRLWIKKEYKDGFGTQVPPTKEQVNIYFVNADSNEEQAERFYQHYIRKEWKNRKGKLLQNLKKLAWTWILNLIVKR